MGGSRVPTTPQCEGAGIFGRISYVIAPDGHILNNYTDEDAPRHIEYSMKAVKEYVAAHK
jgi:peroxiredoxin (alkyl hydroperoxide reductase subunit C)